jgi:hypothetical protein
MKRCLSFVLLLALTCTCAPGAAPRPATPGQGHVTPGPGAAFPRQRSAHGLISRVPET